VTEEEVAKAVLDAAFKVHTALGPGLLESVYESALSIELSRQSVEVERQKPIPVSYDGVPLEIGFCADLIVNGMVLVEVKSVEAILPVHKKATNSYLRLIPLKLGLLINFNEAHLKDGVVRIVNGVEGKPFLQVDLRKGAERQTGQKPRY
jgi:GxxExxY protein